MNKKMLRFLLSTLCLAVLLAGRTVVGEDGANSADRLRTLETQQTGESRKLSKVAGDVAWLLAELESNGLLEQGGGEKVKTLKVAVSDVAHDRLPLAARHLRNARLERDASRHHITSADQEVDAILEQLKAVLAGSSTLIAGEELVQELKDMIKVQTQVRSQTAEWGKTMLISPETAGAGKGPLMQDQARILPRYKKFLEKLQKARDDALDDASKSRFQQAENVLNPAPPTSENKAVNEILTPEPTTGDVLQAAIDQIDRSDVIAAVGAQDRAIASFKSALQILSAGQFELEEFVAGLAKLIEKQKILRKDTAAEEDLVQRGVLLEARQREIADEVTDYSFEAPDLFVSKEGEYLVEPLMTALGQAVSALQAAQRDEVAAVREALLAARKKETKEGKNEALAALKAARKDKVLTAQDKVIALLESVYGTATEALDNEGNPFFAESPEVPEDMWLISPDGDAEDEALPDPGFPELFEDAGITSAELMIQYGEPGGGSDPEDFPAADEEPPGTTAYAANRFISLEEDAGEPPPFIVDTGPPQVGHDNAPNAPGDAEAEGSTSEVEKDRLARNSMQRQRRKAKIQDYVRQLPPEFRKQVADYYEVIAE